MKYLFIFIGLFSSLPCLAQSALGLLEVFNRAQQGTENLSIEETRTQRAEEKKIQARGAFLPQISAQASYLRQDPLPKTNSTTSSSGKADQTNARLTLNQSLFEGFSVFSNFRATGADLNAQKALAEQARQSLYLSVGQSFYGVIQAQQDLSNLNMLLDLTTKRIDELKGRSKIGKSRVSEVLTARSQASTLLTEMQSAEMTLEQSRDSFAAVTGLDRDTELQSNSKEWPQALDTLENYTQTLEKRPDVIALREALNAAEERIGVARSGHWPSLDLEGNYYLKRMGVLEDSKWDVGLNLKFPLFEGGITQSGVREAASQVREAELLLAQKRRTAMSDIRIAYQGVAGGLRQMKSLEEGMVLAEKNYQEQTQDYRYGRSTNLDVILALNALQETKRALDRTKYQTLMAWVALQAATGKLPQKQGM